MDWNKFLNILLFTIAFTLIFQWVMGPQTKTNPLTTNTVYLEVKSDSTVIPNIPIVDIANTTSGAVQIETCRDIKIFIDSLPLDKLETEAPTFCTGLTVPAGGKTLLPLSPIAKAFAEKPGKYLIKLSINNTEKVVTIDHSSPGAFRSLLSTVVFEPIYNFFIALLSFLPNHNLGWAIIIITLIIRLILLYPQQKMLESQKQLQLIQPKIKALQEKYKGDQATLGMEMMSLYKKEGVNPMGSCLPLFIQMPILIGLYWVVSGVNDPANFYHLYSFFKGFDVSTINAHFYGLNLTSVGGVVGAIFALVLGFIQWVQARLSFTYNPPAQSESKVIEKTSDGTYEPKDVALDPALMQKMMLYMLPVMIATSSFFFPLGVGLYWFIGTLFVIAQQWYVNQKSEKKKQKYTANT